MRQIFLILIIPFLIIGCENKSNHENNVLNGTLGKDTCIGIKAQVVFVDKTTYNWMYLGVSNAIKIVTKNISEDQIIVKSDLNIPVVRIGDNYIVTPKELKKIKILVYNKSNNSLLYEREYFVKRIQNIVATVAGKRSGEIDKQGLLDAIGINAYTENIDIDCNYEVSSFTVSTVDKKGNVIENVSSSGRFTPEQLKQIKNLKSGQKIYFENIIIVDFDGSKRHIGLIMLKIK